MSLSGIIRRGRETIPLLFLSLCSSCSSSCSCWTIQETHPDCAEISATRLVCPPTNICEHIEVEVLQGDYGRKTSIHLLAGQAPSLPTDLSRSRVILSNQHEKRSYIVQKMAGGQSLLLPAEAEAFLFASLLDGEDIRITVGYQKKEVPSDPFIRKNLMDLGCIR